MSNLVQPVLSLLYLSGRSSNGFASGTVEYLQWFAYPIAVFQISRHEKWLYNTSILRGELSDLLEDVEQGRELHNDKVLCLSDAHWDGVPWELLENP
jgi:hypothetical protein